MDEFLTNENRYCVWGMIKRVKGDEMLFRKHFSVSVLCRNNSKKNNTQAIGFA